MQAINTMHRDTSSTISIHETFYKRVLGSLGDFKRNIFLNDVKNKKTVTAIEKWSLGADVSSYNSRVGTFSAQPRPASVTNS